MRCSTRPGRSKMFKTGPYSKPHKSPTWTGTYEYEGETRLTVWNERKKRMYRHFWDM